MLTNEKKICEYFLISGFNKTRKPYDLSQIHNQGEEICNANIEIGTDFFHYKEPIVDIQIVNIGPRERLTDGYHIVDRTYSKLNKADLNGKASVDELYLCFRYGRDRPPITDIWAINPKQKNITNQENWILIEKTMNGHSANLHTSSTNPLFIAYRRAPVNAPVDNLVVTDICVILTNKNEFCPPAYSRVDVAIKRTPLSHTINICYKKSIVKQHVLSYQPEIIYCLPSSSTEPIVDEYNPNPDHCKTSVALPEDIRDVANFCMPWGATLESWSSELRTPRPSFVTFVLTNINYDRMYGAAMLFYEDFDEEQLTEEESINLGLRAEGRKNMKVFGSKSICLLSRWPLFQTFNTVLSFLIQEDERQRSGRVLESCPFNLPLERFISQFLHSVPFPTPEAPNILLQWDLENAIGIQLPTDAISKFGTSENFYHLVRMLDVEEIIQLFVYMLTEQKILLTSTCNSDLTGIAEALISMIFPFKWSVVYIPFLYLSCIHIIQSPSPYLIGVDSRFFDYFRLPEGVGCIDLINKSIKPPEVASKSLDYTKVLPKSVLRSLRTCLSNCKTKVISFEKQQNIRKTTGNLIDDFTILRKKEIIGESIRECFLRAVVLMFKNYQKYLVPLSYRQKEDDMFDAEGFIKSVDRNSRPLYQAIFDTQLWNHFILERSYATEFDDSLAFFDRCIKYLRTMDDEQANVSSLLQTDSVIKSEHTKVIPPPDPVEGWSADVGRSTFPQRLDSALMLPSIHCALLSPVTNTPTNEQSVDPDSPDSSIPVLHIRSSDIGATASRITKATVLKRPFEELKQARHLGKEAKRGPGYAWAGHVLTSSYCLWYLSLPGLIGYVEDTPGLRESGLADRILELAVQMLDSINNYRLVLPDEVCFRVLLLLVHQLHPSRLRVSDIRKHADLNAFSYGLCNQILLEEETQLSLMANRNSVPCDTSANESDKVGESDKHVTCGNGGTDEKDCDSGRETLASNNTMSTDTPDGGVCGSTNNDTTTPLGDTKSARDHCLIDIGGKPVRLRGPHQGPRKRTDRMSNLLFQSPLDLCAIDTERTHQFFDQSAGIIMSSTPHIATTISNTRTMADTPTPPILALHKSPNHMDEHKPDMSTPSTMPAIILRCPFSEEKSELHASYMTRKRVSNDSSNASSDKLSSGHDTGSDPVAHGTPTNRDTSKLSDPRLIQSDVASTTNITTKTRASFRQLKSAANKSLRSMRSMMSSMGSGAWLSPGDGHVPASSPHTQYNGQYGLPATYKPWDPRGPRLKTTASADILNTISDEPSKVHATSRPCAGTVQQLRRQHNLGTQWPNSGSTESCHSDQRSHQYSSTNSLDTDPPVPIVDKLWEKITDSLAAVQLPTGKYWPEDEPDNGESSSPSVECSQSLSVRMTTCTECTNCHYMIYDDDIMSGWSCNDSDLQSLCSYCEGRFAPILTFQVFIDHTDPSDPIKPRSNSVTTRSTLAYKSQINYLSPFVLRKELESVLQQEGETALLVHSFIQDHAILYWNLIWYYGRLSLPSHMLSFLTLWLRDKGLALVAVSEDNIPKYEILTNLTGHEQVAVALVWELNQLSGRTGPPLYHKLLAAGASNTVGGVLAPMNSPSRNFLDEVINSLYNSNMERAIYLMLSIRVHNRNKGVTAALAINERSVYRELMHLAMVVLYRFGLNLDTFHSMYVNEWDRIVKDHPEVNLPLDRPPTDATFFCRKVFQPLILL